MSLMSLHWPNERPYMRITWGYPPVAYPLETVLDAFGVHLGTSKSIFTLTST